MSERRSKILVRNTRPEDFEDIIRITGLVYPGTTAWTRRQLTSHLAIFPEGQLVAVDAESGRAVGMAAGLIVSWKEYELEDAWKDFTDHGMFTNHDPQGGTLYGAEVMVHPDWQGRGVGSLLYRERRGLVRRLGLRRIRAGARLAGYHRFADRMSAEEYVRRVIRGELQDPTLSFQLGQGFEVIGVVSDYLGSDRESRNYAAVIEWLNPDFPDEREAAVRRSRFPRANENPED